MGTAARFVPGRWALSPEREAAIDLHRPANYAGLPGALSDGVLLTSRGGSRIDRIFLESFIRVRPDPRDWKVVLKDADQYSFRFDGGDA